MTEYDADKLLAEFMLEVFASAKEQGFEPGFLKMTPRARELYVQLRRGLIGEKP